MNDKLLRGIIAGAIAGIIKDILPLILYATNHNVFPTYWDYAGKIAFGKIPEAWWEITYAIVFEVCFSIGVGVIMVHLMPKIKSSLWYIKGAALGFAVWFLIRMGVSLFSLKEFTQPHIYVSTINALTSIGYGVLIAFLDGFLKNYRKNS